MVAVGQPVTVLGRGHGLNRSARPIQRLALPETAVGYGVNGGERLQDAIGNLALLVRGKPGQRLLDRLPLLLCHLAHPSPEAFNARLSLSQPARRAKPPPCMHVPDFDFGDCKQLENCPQRPSDNYRKKNIGFLYMQKRCQVPLLTS
jgi:hypothetical protein